MPQFLKYFQLVKVDESTHTISGIATAEVPDKDGEICDYEDAKAAYQAWSKEALDSTKAAGQDLSYGNIRVQHTLEIGGKVASPVIFDDENKTIHLVTEPENDAIFTKAKKGFIRGFSQGGDYAWRKCNECRTDIAEGNDCPQCKKAVFIRYAPVLAEVSYVDNPCVKAATFTLVKADGSHEQTPFSEGSSSVEPTQPAGTPAFDVTALTAQITKSVMERLGKSVKHLVTEKDGTTHLPYTDDSGQPDHKLMGAAWAALHGGYRGKKYEGPDKDKAIERLEAVYEKEGLDTPEEKVKKAIAAAFAKASEKRGLQKGMYDVSRFADLLQSLNYLREGAVYERDYEQDGSSLPEDLLADIERLAETFLAMAEEETKELTAIAGGKGHTKMNNNSTLAKAHKSLAEHIQKAKDTATAHCDKMCKAQQDHKDAMHQCFDKLHKMLGAEEPDEKEVSGENEPHSLDPMKEGTPGSMKTAGASFTKAQVDDLVQKTVDETVRAVLKAMSDSDEEEEETAEEKKARKEAKKAAPASGIGDRSETPLIASNAGPVIKVMPVTKAQDTQPASASAAEPVTAAELSAAMAGDPATALKFMKGVRSESGVPPTVAGALSSVKR